MPLISQLILRALRVIAHQATLQGLPNSKLVAIIRSAGLSKAGVYEKDHLVERALEACAVKAAAAERARVELQAIASACLHDPFFSWSSSRLG